MIHKGKTKIYDTNIIMNYSDFPKCFGSTTIGGDIAGDAAKDAAKDAAEDAGEKSAKEAAEKSAEEAAKDAAEKSAKDAAKKEAMSFKDFSKNAVKKGSKILKYAAVGGGFLYYMKNEADTKKAQKKCESYCNPTDKIKSKDDMKKKYGKDADNFISSYWDITKSEGWDWDTQPFCDDEAKKSVVDGNCEYYCELKCANMFKSSTQQVADNVKNDILNSLPTIFGGTSDAILYVIIGIICVIFIVGVIRMIMRKK